MKTLKNKRGFTLVELVVVMVILGILAVILIPRITQVQEGARKTACHANLRILDSVTAIWMSDDPKNNTFDSLSIDALVKAKLIKDGDAICPSKAAYIKPTASGPDSDAQRWKCETHKYSGASMTEITTTTPSGGSNTSITPTKEEEKP